MHPSPSPSAGAPPLPRLIARAAGTTPAPPAIGVAQQLAEWIDWPRAVELSQALQAPVPEVADVSPDMERLRAEYRELRAGLAADIQAGPKRAPASGGFAPFQRHIQTMQRAMLGASGRLRGDLRECLAAGTAAQARLAAVDAQMEAALSPRESALLAGVAEALGQRFERLRARAADDPATAATQDDGAARVRIFRLELRDVLLAELDLRFQPLEGLLAALRSP